MKTLLIDIDGVLRSGTILLPGAEKFITYVQENDLNACLLSNSTKFSSRAIISFFAEKGITLTIPVITAVDVTAKMIKSKFKTASVYCVPSAKQELQIVPDAPNPEVVVIGDLADYWTYELLNEMFNKVRAGAKLLAMQKNKFGHSSKGLYLDAGAFIKALEYACGVEAELVGKPSSKYFEIARERAGDKLNEYIMIGDDLFVDIEPTNYLGGTSVLLLSGKTDEKTLNESSIQAHHVYKNLHDLMLNFNQLLDDSSSKN